MSVRRVGGFTLIEAVVALAIVALGMMAVSTALNQYAIAAAQTEQKTLASWIAANKLAELSVGNTWPRVGSSDEDVEFAGQQWRLDIAVSETQVENLHRVDVSVFLRDAPDRLVHKASGFIEPPTPAGFQPPRWSAPLPTGEAG